MFFSPSPRIFHPSCHSVLRNEIENKYKQNVNFVLKRWNGKQKKLISTQTQHERENYIFSAQINTGSVLKDYKVLIRR